MLRAAMVEKRAMGWVIVNTGGAFRQDRGGVTYVDPFGCVGAKMSDWATALDIWTHPLGTIFYNPIACISRGLHGITLTDGEPEWFRPWFDVGARLRAEFLPMETT